MSYVYIDRDGFEWKKNCNNCSNRNERKNSQGTTYCDSLREFITDRCQFADYYSQTPNNCPHFFPR